MSWVEKVGFRGYRRFVGKDLAELIMLKMPFTQWVVITLDSLSRGGLRTRPVWRCGDMSCDANPLHKASLPDGHSPFPTRTVLVES